MGNDLETADVKLHVSPGRRRRIAWLLVAAILAALSGAIHVFVRAGTGLTEVVYEDTGPLAVSRSERRVQTIDLGALDAPENRARREHVSLRWRGVWVISRDGLYDLLIDANAGAVWKIDGHQAHARTAGDAAMARRTVWLQAGLHSIDVDYQPAGGDSRLDVTWAPTGGAPRALPAVDLLPAMPAHPHMYVALRSVDRASTFVWLAAAIVAGIIGLGWAARRVSARFFVSESTGILDTSGEPAFATSRATRIVALSLLVLIASYGAALRLEAIAVRYGPVASPSWLRALQERTVAVVPAIRPRAMTWAPVEPSPHRDGTWTNYSSDPYTYLLYAREMRSFYAAHYREPVFTFTTKVFLWWLDNQDVAVSFASAAFSVLTIFATYMAGTAAFGSRWIGLGAAFGMAIERDLISWGVSGWRDDAFAFAVMLSVYALLVYRRTPSTGRAIALGAVAAFACLTRIFALAFLAPGFLYLLLTSPALWRDRVRDIAIATGVMAVLVLPYLVNCWRVYGDPLYTLNYQPLSYLAWEGAHPTTPPGAFGYIGEKVMKAPFRTLDTVALGMTTYPFLSKWQGFDAWRPGLGTGLAVLAIAGLVGWVGSRNGRLLLLVLASAQVPFAFTWKLSSDWRYTEFAYPFYLIAASAAIVQVVTFAWRPVRPGSRPLRYWHTRLAFWVGVGVALGAAVWGVQRTLPVLTLGESLHADGVAVVQAGDRDTAFFAEGWSRPMTNGNVTTRVSHGAFQVLTLPLPRAVDYAMVFRMDPFPRPLADPASPVRVRVFMNGTPVAQLELQWNPERVGAYPIRVPGLSVTPGQNRLVLMMDGVAPPPVGGPPTQPGLSEWAAFSFWNVSIRPL